MLLKQGYLFTHFVSHEKIIEEQKVEYYLALNKTHAIWKSDNENIAPWLLFFLNVIKAQSVDALKIVSEETIEHLLSEKQLEVWKWIHEEEDTFTRKDLISAFGYPARTVESIIKKLYDMNRLEKLGEGRATRYKLKR
jgi:Fic family protein